MINAATPLFVALVAATAVRQLPSRLQVVGLLVGFGGVVAISLPSVGSGSNALGVVLVLGAAFLYGFAFNIAGPLQRQHGSLPVIWRAQLVAVGAAAARSPPTAPRRPRSAGRACSPWSRSDRSAPRWPSSGSPR